MATWKASSTKAKRFMNLVGISSPIFHVEQTKADLQKTLVT